MPSDIDLSRLRQLKNQVAIVGVGDTDYASDYRDTRGKVVGRGELRNDRYLLAARAFTRALEDAGLKKDQIDGISTGGPIAHDRLSEILGLTPRWGASGDAPHSIVGALNAIASGICTTVACVYGFAPRSENIEFGGEQAATGGGPLNYSYYAPWGMTSQGALLALQFKRYQLRFGMSEEELAAIPIAFRRHASLNPNAVMREPLAKEAYLAGAYIVEPFRIFDYCLVNDGGVALIVQRADLARDARHPPVMVSGFGYSEIGAHLDAAQYRPRLVDFYYTSYRDTAAQVFGMAGIERRDVDVFATYDAFSSHLLYALEGFGFCGEGEARSFIQDGRIELGGELPCNTSGGMLSESYMQSWNHQVELVRQLRGGLGERQVAGARVGMYTQHTSGKSISLIYTGEA